MRPSRPVRLLVTTTLSLVLAAAGCGTSHDPDDGGTGDAGGELFACEVDTDCIVVPESCCGSCGAATRGDALAMSGDAAGDYLTSVCAGMGCHICYMAQDPTLVATCDAGRCELVDLHEHPVARCSSDADCRLRTRSCCDCGGDTSREGLLAVRTDSAAGYVELVCDMGASEPCLECAPVYPDEATASCNPGGWCEAIWATPGP